MGQIWDISSVKCVDPMVMRRDHTVLPPIIFVTGMHNPVLEESVMTAGARACLSKKTLTKEILNEAVLDALGA